MASSLGFGYVGVVFALVSGYMWLLGVAVSLGLGALFVFQWHYWQVIAVGMLLGPAIVMVFAGISVRTPPSFTPRRVSHGRVDGAAHEPQYEPQPPTLCVHVPSVPRHARGSGASPLSAAHKHAVAWHS